MLLPTYQLSCPSLTIHGNHNTSRSFAFLVQMILRILGESRLFDEKELAAAI